MSEWAVPGSKENQATETHAGREPLRSRRERRALLPGSAPAGQEAWHAGMQGALVGPRGEGAALLSFSQEEGSSQSKGRHRKTGWGDSSETSHSTIPAKWPAAQ